MNFNTYNYYINEIFGISQNTGIYAEFCVDTNAYDYIFVINAGYDGNFLFNNRYYSEPNKDINNINVDLSINLSRINSILTKNKLQTTPSLGYNPDNSILNTDEPFGLRMLEVIAIKIFGHAKARAAIMNDTEFYKDFSYENSLINQIGHGMNNGINNKRISMFKQYVYYDLMEKSPQDDTITAGNFNFELGRWDFPMFFQSTLYNDELNAKLLRKVGNGPYMGGNQLVNGSMTVPILLRFYTEQRPEYNGETTASGGITNPQNIIINSLGGNGIFNVDVIYEYDNNNSLTYSLNGTVYNLFGANEYTQIYFTGSG